jgi:hypothetical protein
VKTLVFLFGPPAVGKMTVGEALSRRTGYPLFHNHLSIEAVLPLFDFGSPPFGRLVGEFRRRAFEEVADSHHEGLIFTYVWAFDQPGDRQFVERMKAIFESRGGRTVFVELWADQATRLERNATEPRLTRKPSKRDLAASRDRLLSIDARYRLRSNGGFPFADHLEIDNTALDPAIVADRIVTHFALPSSQS